jgi:hypothetical protein
MQKDIKAYNGKLKGADKAICSILEKEISDMVPDKESKVWHGHPVWFINGNPIVGYAKRKVGVTLLFWSGQSFQEKGLKKEGSFKAAEAKYMSKDGVNVKDLRRWLKKAKTIQWDYKNIVKRKGKLIKIVK